MFLSSFFLIFIFSFIVQSCSVDDLKQELGMKSGPLAYYEHLDDFDIDYFPHLQANTSLDVLRLRIKAFGETFFIHLEPNHDIFHPKASIFIHQGTQQPIELLKSEHLNIRLYKGRVLKQDHSQNIFTLGFQSPYLAPFQEELEEDVGWARFSFYDLPTNGKPIVQYPKDQLKFEGVFTKGSEVYNVKLVDTYKKSKLPKDADLTQRAVKEKIQILIFRESDRLPALNGLSKASTCGSDTLHFNRELAQDYLRDRLQRVEYERSKNPLTKRAAPGCPTAKKILYMGVAADCSYTSNYGGNSQALQQILSDWNQASKIYESSFNVVLGILQVNIQSSCGGDPWNQQCTPAYTIQQRLSDFSQWRANQKDNLGLWHLMTRCSTGPTVGISWLGSVCERQGGFQVDDQTGQREYVNGAGVSTISSSEWLIVAHEIGHNFGAQHDCTDSGCSNCCPCSAGSCSCHGQFIMNPTSDVQTTTFSPCSTSTICKTTGAMLGMPNCLLDPGQATLISGNMCGNGVKEQNEECDCGPAQSDDCKNDPCCDGSTCKLKQGAQCDDKNDGCCSNCKIKSSGTVCRPSRGDCDIQEVCDGKSGNCPIDQYKPDLQQCQIDAKTGGQCASGDCTSRDYQCKLRGQQAGVNQECPGFSDSCTINCMMPNTLGTCLQISGFFEDGTPCGFTGVCKSGTCQQSPWSAFIGWSQAHLGIVIVIAAIIGIILLFCCWRCFQVYVQKKRPQRRQPAPIQTQQPFMMPAQMTAPTAYPGSAKWVDPQLYNGTVLPEEMDIATLSAIMEAQSPDKDRPRHRSPTRQLPGKPLPSAPEEQPALPPKDYDR